VHASESSEYEAFEIAKTIDETAAYESISMGMGQVMGFNYGSLGYTSAKAMFDKFSSDESTQVQGMATFISNNSGCKQAVLNKDPYAFERYYNGGVSGYAEKIAAAYKNITGKGL